MFTALADAVAHGPYGPSGGWDHMGGANAWWFIFPLLWFLLFAAVVFLIARRTRHGLGGGPGGVPPWAQDRPGSPGRPSDYPPTAGGDPVTILAGRFARGEIDEPEFRSRLAALRSGGAGGPGGPTPPATTDA